MLPMSELDPQTLKLFSEEHLLLNDVVQDDADLLFLDTYLTDIFKTELMEEIDERLESMEARLNALNNDNSMYEEPEVQQPVSAVYEVVELGLGDALYAVSACDIMLRAGQATCIAPDPTQGISNYTVGAEIYNGEYLTKNHMCLIPRGDGRGVLAQSESVFFMVKGDYTIVEG